MTAPDTPAGLGPSGRALWGDVVGSWILRPDELVVLERACRVRDRLYRLDEALSKVAVVDAGSRKQDRVHPVVAELRQTELVLAGLLRQLGLDDSVDVPNAGRSAAARELALKRWGR